MNEEQNTKSVFIQLVPFIVIVVFALAIYIGFVYFTSNTQENVGHLEEPTEEQGSEPNYTIEEVPFDIADIAPNLNRGIQFGDIIPQQVREMLNAQAGGLRENLTKDIKDADSWFNLAIIYHTANDYEGAAEVWKFLIQVIPDNTVAYDNLGKLYHFDLKNFPKSESYFNQSLAIDIGNINAYLGLLELYRYSYKTESTAAADILKKAIVQFPDRLDLVLTLGAYYAEVGNYTMAREVLQEGLDKARDIADVDMITAFGVELGRLPQ